MDAMLHFSPLTDNLQVEYSSKYLPYLPSAQTAHCEPIISRKPVSKSAVETHSDATATLLPFGSIATYLTGTPATDVKGASNSFESRRYRLTSVSSLPENQ